MAGVMNEFAEAHDGFGYLIECVQHLPGLLTTVVPWLSGEQHKELVRKYRNRVDWCFIIKDRGAGSVTLDENGQAAHWYPFTDELDRRHVREAIVTSIRMHEAAGAQQIYSAGQPFAPWSRGEDLEAFVEKVNQIPIGPGVTSVFALHQMSSAKAGQRPADLSSRNPSGELHDTTGGLDRRRQRHAHLIRGEPLFVRDGARAPKRDEYACIPITLDCPGTVTGGVNG